MLLKNSCNVQHTKKTSYTESNNIFLQIYTTVQIIIRLMQKIELNYDKI